mmetsp:Transcript_9900/g.27045  ORF Transcript_9900/g.27045 Transcript_9900/m.27045 type:complete len:97 (-) Transcript_9900:8-298(-)
MRADSKDGAIGLALSHLETERRSLQHNTARRITPENGSCWLLHSFALHSMLLHASLSPRASQPTKQTLNECIGHTPTTTFSTCTITHHHKSHQYIR